MGPLGSDKNIKAKLAKGTGPHKAVNVIHHSMPTYVGMEGSLQMTYSMPTNVGIGNSFIEILLYIIFSHL